MLVKMFKSSRNTHRFKKNQKVWIRHEFANHLNIRHKWRGSGRYVNGVIDKWDWTKDGGYNKTIGIEGLKEIDISENDARRIGIYGC